MPTPLVPGEEATPLQRFVGAAFATIVAMWLAAASFALFTRNNDFPISYHPDEDGKVEQLVSPTSERNFRHPLMLLETAQLALHLKDVSPGDGRAVAIAGRSASAFLASVGVFACALLGYAIAGWIGLAIVGPTVALCPPLLVYAHYLKEDASLVGGLAVATLGVGLVLSTSRALPQLGATLVLGVGCAMAASGKYVGAAAAAPALLAVLIAPLASWWQWPTRLVLFVAVTVAAAVAINFRAFEDPWHLTLKPVVESQFDWEYTHGTTGHSGVALPVPNAFVLRVARGEVMPHLWAMALVGGLLLIALVVRDRRWPISRVAIAMAALPATFAVVLSHNTIPFERYALPITFFAYVLAALLIAAAIARLARDHRRSALVAAALTATVIVVAQGRRCLDFDRRFADDSRQRLREWLAANAPPGSIVVADWFSNLHQEPDNWRFPGRPEPRIRLRMNSGYAAGGAGSSLEAMAANGVRYVVAVRTTYSRFFAEGIQTIDPSNNDWLKRTQHFYNDLFDRGDLVWSNLPNPVANGYVDPEIRVYKIDRLRPSNLPPPPPTPLERWAREMERRRRAGTQPAK